MLKHYLIFIQPALRIAEMSVGCVVDLLERHPYFNYSRNIVQMLTPYLNHRSEPVRTRVANGFTRVFKDDKKGEITLDVSIGNGNTFVFFKAWLYVRNILCDDSVKSRTVRPWLLEPILSELLVNWNHLKKLRKKIITKETFQTLLNIYMFIFNLLCWKNNNKKLIFCIKYFIILFI